MVSGSGSVVASVSASVVVVVCSVVVVVVGSVVVVVVVGAGLQLSTSSSCSHLVRFYFKIFYFTAYKRWR